MNSIIKAIIGFVGKAVAVRGRDGLSVAEYIIRTSEIRKKTPCLFDNKITSEEFEQVVKLEMQKYEARIDEFVVSQAGVYGVVRSNTGHSKWFFTIDFNDNGSLTGRYWILTTNSQSELPQKLAAGISNRVLEMLSQ